MAHRIKPPKNEFFSMACLVVDRVGFSGIFNPPSGNPRATVGGGEPITESFTMDSYSFEQARHDAAVCELMKEVVRHSPEAIFAVLEALREHAACPPDSASRPPLDRRPGA